MTGFRALFLDDEQPALQASRQLLRHVPEIDRADFHTDAGSAARALADRPYDLLFLDIELADRNGLDFLRALAQPPVTVLMTAHAEYAVDAFALGVRDYLLKPVSVARMARCLALVSPLVSPTAGTRRLAVKQGTGHHLFDPSTVAYIAAEGNFSVLETDSGRIFASEPLGTLVSRLAPFGFLRIHKSFAVHRDRVVKTAATRLILETGHALPIGRVYRAAVTQTLAQGG